MKKITRGLNTDSFYHLLDLEIKRARRYKLYFSLLIGELNIKYTHRTKVEKDIVKKLAKFIGNELRDSDIIGHDGEKRFFILLLETEHHTASIVGERLRKLVYEYLFDYDDYIKFSVGGARFPSDEIDKDSLISKAQDLLDQAVKHEGNLVLLSDNSYQCIKEGSNLNRSM